jgi:REP element-mobilizing transposase RayT
MSVWRRFEGHGFPSIITTNTAERRPVFKEELVADHLARTIANVQREEGLVVVAWAIMPDHFHIVMAVSAGGTFGRAVQMIKGRFAREFNLACGRSGAVWQDRYHERALRDDRQLWAAVQYVLNNPVAGGLVANWWDHRWCYLGATDDWSG